MSDVSTSSSTNHSPTGRSWRVQALHEIQYDVELTPGLLELENPILADHCGDRVLCVLDDRVEALWGPQIRTYFAHRGVDAVAIVLEGDEDAKTLGSVTQVTDAMADAGLLRRSETVVVFGGGVAMDVVGLAANLYRRGVPYVRVPTTLLGMVDAGVGVKTGVNREDHKNRLGTYFAPTVTLIDGTFLKTLPTRHLRNGLAEIIKIAFVKDLRLLEVVESCGSASGATADLGPEDVTHELLSRPIAGMLDELEPNLHEETLERVVDFGHTFSPSLELIADPPLLHGEAVSVDMALCIALSSGRGLLTDAEVDRALAALRRHGLPVVNDRFTPELLVQALADTIKHRDGLQRIPLLDGLGSATFVNDISEDEIRAAHALTLRLDDVVEAAVG